ncbi:MAG: cytochrome c-type biogenesis protein CcmH, partial [Litorilinea sp.]
MIIPVISPVITRCKTVRLRRAGWSAAPLFVTPRATGRVLTACLTACIVGLCVWLLPLAQPVAAQDAQPSDGETVTGWMNTPGVSPDEVNQVATEIWCPLCSGVRLDSCELRACDQMKDVIALKLAEGEDSAAIKDYFLAQYGPQVLGEPPRTGFNWLAWILPFVAVAGGGFFLWRQARRLVGPRDEPMFPAASTTSSATPSPEPATDA